MEAIDVAMELEVVVDDEMMEAGNGHNDEPSAEVRRSPSRRRSGI